jgi:hypothetical protein
MPSRKAEPRTVWEADVTLSVEKIALAAQYVESGKGSQTKRNLVATDWLDHDKKTIIFDTGKRLKGWFKEQALTLGGQTKRDLLSYGVICKSLPKSGFAPIANISEIAKSRTWESFSHKDDYVLGTLPAPEVEVIITEHGSIFSLYYVLEKPIDLQARIFSFARGLGPDLVKDWLQKLGEAKGLSDKHNSSAGYGTFILKEWKFLV